MKESIGQEDPRLDAEWIRRAPRHDPDCGAATWPLDYLLWHAKQCPNCKLGGLYCYWHMAWIKPHLTGALSVVMGAKLSIVEGAELSIMGIGEDK